MSKGGARRAAIEAVDMDQLHQIFQGFVDKGGADAFHLGPYDDRKSAQACSAEGLHLNAEYIKRLVGCSTGEIPGGQLKQAIQKYAPSHNKSNFKDDLWAGQKASQFICLLSHWRRLKGNKQKLEQCLKQATGAQRSSIMELMELKPGVCKKAELPLRSSSSQPLACEKATEKKEVQPGRKLKVEISDVSLDSSGFPLMLSSPKEKEEKKPETTKSDSILEKQRASQRMALQEAAEEAASRVAKPERRPDHPTSKEELSRLKRPAGFFKRPATPKRPKAKKQKKTPAEIPAEAMPERRPWSAYKKTLATKQSYLQGVYEDGNVKLIVGCSEKMGQDFPGGHQGVIRKLEELVMQDDVTKEKMLEHRNRLLSQNA